MSIWVIAFAASTALACAGFVVVAVLWLKKLRDTLASALKETASQQLRTSQRFGETIAQMQRKQQLYEQRLQTLTEANIRMRQELNLVAGKIEIEEHAEKAPASSSRLFH